MRSSSPSCKLHNYNMLRPQPRLIQTFLKALAFGNRTENKDAYDLFYVWSGVGIPNVVESLTPLLPNTYIYNALQVIERDFCNHDGLGPIGAAQFVTQGLDNNIQADVVGFAQALLRSL